MFCLQSAIPADSLDSDIKTLYLNIAAASGHGVNQSDEVTGFNPVCYNHYMYWLVARPLISIGCYSSVSLVIASFLLTHFASSSFFGSSEIDYGL